jgi:hypothetical protein
LHPGINITFNEIVNGFDKVLCSLCNGIEIAEKGKRERKLKPVLLFPLIPWLMPAMFYESEMLWLYFAKGAD